MPWTCAKADQAGGSDKVKAGKVSDASWPSARARKRPCCQTPFARVEGVCLRRTCCFHKVADANQVSSYMFRCSGVLFTCSQPVKQLL